VARSIWRVCSGKAILAVPVPLLMQMKKKKREKESDACFLIDEQGRNAITVRNVCVQGELSLWNTIHQPHGKTQKKST